LQKFRPVNIIVVSDAVSAKKNKIRMKKVLRETQTLRAGCSKAEPQKFAPPQTSFQRRGASNILSAEEGRWSLYVYLKTQFGKDRCTQFRVIVVIDPHTHPQTPPARPLQTVAYLGFQKSVPLPSVPPFPSLPSRHMFNAQSLSALCYLTT